MLIYNSKKEFLGIDASDLELLGFKNLGELRAEAADFADLFVKTPGYIHNFKHVHWIDFITCADSSETPKAIIHAKEKSYRCDMNISTAYLTDDPSSEAYLVNLQNLRTLTKGENSEISQDVLIKPAPQSIAYDEPVVPEEKELKTVTIAEPVAEVFKEEIVEDDYDTSLKLEENPYEDIKEPHSIEDNYDKSFLDTPLDIDLEDEVITKPIIQESIKEEPKIPEPPKAVLPRNDIKEEEIGYNSTYVFDPKIASDELGLPIDLIEEFIEDFIAQANDFKDDLYQSLHDGDLDNVHILSHKLKGVAANLRVEDAFEVLAIINTSDNIDIIEKNLKYLYIIIAKLAGVEPAAEPIQTLAIEEVKEETEDDFVLEFKELDEPEIKTEPIETPVETIEDSNIPQKIDIPELADDTFMDNETIQKLEIDEKSLAVDIETADEIELAKDIPDIEELPELLETPEDIKEEIEDAPLELLQEIEEEVTIEEEPRYNKKEVAEEIGLDQETFNELLQDYISDSKELCNSITDAVTSDNSNIWKKEALKLKGMSKNMRVATFSSELETLLSTNDKDLAQSAIKTISNQISKISDTRD